MTHILLEGYDIDQPWLYPELKKFIVPGSKVAIVAFSFRDSQAKNAEQWDALYGKANGRFYRGIVNALESYGVSEDDIWFINYYADTKAFAERKVRGADIVYFLGGLPDRMMERIDEFGLRDVLMGHDGVFMGYSAGAVIQLAQYHLSPDDDYPDFSYYQGLPFLDDFYLEVHYEGTDAQKDAIFQVLSQRKKRVYATALGKGAIVIDNGDVKLLGDVKVFDPE